MNPIIIPYIGDKFVEDLDCKRIPSMELANELYKYPLIDELRKKVKFRHLGLIKKFINEDNTSLCKLGIGLLSKFMNNQSVYNYVTKLWARKDSVMENKIAIQFRLLESKHLEKRILKELIDFIFNNWDDWLQVEKEWVGDDVLELCRKRIKESSKQKRWIYICLIAVDKDKNRAIKFIRENSNHNKDNLIKLISLRVTQKLKE